MSCGCVGRLCDAYGSRLVDVGKEFILGGVR